MKNTYRTINVSSKFLLKEKQSKFIGYAFPIHEVELVRKHINNLKKTHHTAGHFCYAYQIGISNKTCRLNDDGEPRNSAGTPIYGQIMSFDLTNILIIVVRYFGGTKLGIGGLISAYKECAKLTIKANNIITKEIIIPIQIKFKFPLINFVMRTVKKYDLEISRREMDEYYVFKVFTTKNNNLIVCNHFRQNPEIDFLQIEI